MHINKFYNFTDSKNWVIFQPNIVIDARLGSMWYVYLKLDSLCSLITNKDKLVEFILQRSNGRTTLLSVLVDLLKNGYSGVLLPTIMNCFDRINGVYK